MSGGTWPCQVELPPSYSSFGHGGHHFLGLWVNCPCIQSWAHAAAPWVWEEAASGCPEEWRPGSRPHRLCRAAAKPADPPRAFTSSPQPLNKPSPAYGTGMTHRRHGPCPESPPLPGQGSSNRPSASSLSGRGAVGGRWAACITRRCTRGRFQVVARAPCPPGWLAGTLPHKDRETRSTDAPPFISEVRQGTLGLLSHEGLQSLACVTAITQGPGSEAALSEPPAAEAGGRGPGRQLLLGLHDVQGLLGQAADGRVGVLPHGLQGCNRKATALCPEVPAGGGGRLGPGAGGGDSPGWLCREGSGGRWQNGNTSFSSSWGPHCVVTSTGSGRPGGLLPALCPDQPSGSSPRSQPHLQLQVKPPNFRESCGPRQPALRDKWWQSCGLEQGEVEGTRGPPPWRGSSWPLWWEKVGCPCAKCSGRVPAGERDAAQREGGQRVDTGGQEGPGQCHPSRVVIPASPRSLQGVGCHSPSYASSMALPASESRACMIWPAGHTAPQGPQRTGALAAPALGFFPNPHTPSLTVFPSPQLAVDASLGSGLFP